jgi:hypothetical protein
MWRAHCAGSAPAKASSRATVKVCSLVDINKEALVKAAEQRAPRAIAFEQDDGIIGGHGLRLNGAIGERQILIDARDAVVDNHVGLFAHGAQNLTAGEG